MTPLGKVNMARGVKARVGGDVEEEQGVEGAGKGGLVSVPDGPADMEKVKKVPRAAIVKLEISAKNHVN